ncbi:glycoside hydrolase family 25 protein [Kitasatospora griseola]|uniref:glycoside hydrolase family 25 protein n=1 Tax=Kitasatospora griseola TaxID=2064 RepID=UPI003821E52E
MTPTLATLRRATVLAVAALALALPTLGRATVADAADGPQAYAVHGFDSSHYNHEAKNGEQAYDWPAIVRGGQQFVYLKATEGTGTADRWFTPDLDGARSVHLIHGAYHYYRPDQDGAAQADHFLDALRAAGHTGGKPGELPPAVDIEECARDGHPLQPAQVEAFLQRVEHATGTAPAVYTRNDIADQCLRGVKDLAAHPGWLARWGGTEPRPLPGSTAWDFWQHSDHARIPGTVGHPMDADVFHGDRAALRRLAHQN